jgi:Leucine-rich repeat (LRR) protein
MSLRKTALVRRSSLHGLISNSSLHTNDDKKLSRSPPTANEISSGNTSSLKPADHSEGDGSSEHTSPLPFLLHYANDIIIPLPSNVAKQKNRSRRSSLKPADDIGLPAYWSERNQNEDSESVVSNASDTSPFPSPRISSKVAGRIKQAKESGVLNLSYCDLTTPDLPSEIWNLTNLKQLNLDGNQITTLPHEIINLRHLEELSLWSNALEVLPVEVCHLKQLRRLMLYHNRLKVLPLELAQLTNLRLLQVEENELIFPPMEICQQGAEVVRSWLQRTASVQLEVTHLPGIRHLVDGTKASRPGELSLGPEGLVFAIKGRKPDFCISKAALIDATSLAGTLRLQVSFRRQLSWQVEEVGQMPNLYKCLKMLFPQREVALIEKHKDRKKQRATRIPRYPDEDIDSSDDERHHRIKSQDSGSSLSYTNRSNSSASSSFLRHSFHYKRYSSRNFGRRHQLAAGQGQSVPAGPFAPSTKITEEQQEKLIWREFYPGDVPESFVGTFLSPEEEAEMEKMKQLEAACPGMGNSAHHIRRGRRRCPSSDVRFMPPMFDSPRWWSRLRSEGGNPILRDTRQ